jgi:phenylacetate-CoA ligase
MKKHPTKPILKKLIGRTNDIAILPSEKITWIDVLLCDKSIIEDDGT